MKTSTKILAGLVVVLVVAFFVYSYKPSSQEVENLQDNLSTTNDTNTNTSKTYKDGAYNVTTDYMSPGGKDSLGVSVTLSGGKISGVTVTNMAGDPTSKKYQDKFIAGIQSAVVGSAIDALSIGVVSGASLATGAFNKALEGVRAQSTVSATN